MQIYTKGTECQILDAKNMRSFGLRQILKHTFAWHQCPESQAVVREMKFAEGANTENAYEIWSFHQIHLNKYSSK